MLNFAGLSAISTSTTLPVGKYAFEIDAVDEGYTSAKGSQAVEFKTRVVDGPDFDSGATTIGTPRTIRLWYPTAEQKDGGVTCLRRIKEMAKALGLDTENDGVDFSGAQGLTFTAKVKLQDGQDGEPQEDYSNFKKYDR